MSNIDNKIKKQINHSTLELNEINNIDWKKIPNTILNYNCNTFINSENSCLENYQGGIKISDYSLKIFKNATFLIEKHLKDKKNVLYAINKLFSDYFIKKNMNLEINIKQQLENAYNEVDIFIDFFGALIFLFYNIGIQIRGKSELKHLFCPENIKSFSSHLGILIFYLIFFS